MKKPYHAAEKTKLKKPAMADFKPSGGMKSKPKSFKGAPKAGAFKYHEGK